MSRAALPLAILLVLTACTSAPPQSPGAATPTALATGSASNGPTPAASVTSEPLPSPMATAASLDAELLTPGTLDVCVALVGAPATSLDEDGLLTGYNIAIAREIGERLSLAVTLRPTLFEDLLDDVAGHQCDISVSSQNITESRLQQVALVPYSQSRQPILVTLGNPKNIDALDALCGLPVSATHGTTHVDLIDGTGDYVGEGLNELCRAGGRTAIDLRTFDTEAAAVQALVDGDVDAYLGNPGYVAEFPDYIQYAYAALPPARQGIAIALDHPAMQAAIAGALAEMVADGAYRAILTEYLPNEESVDIVSIDRP